MPVAPQRVPAIGVRAPEVTPDAYQAARKSCNPVQAVKDLFAVNRRGVIFFDDMDVALRDRNTVQETDDQAVFLSALDGIDVNEGVVYVFTTNCPLSTHRPGVQAARAGSTSFSTSTSPTRTSGERLSIAGTRTFAPASTSTWPSKQTDGLQFRGHRGGEEPPHPATHRREGLGLGVGVRQFRENRQELKEKERHVGFALREPATNGHN